MQGPDGAGQGSTLCSEEAAAQQTAMEITVITDADYRCVWRPCPELLEDDTPGPGEYPDPTAPGIRPLA